MSKRRPKTLGLEWLYHSMTAFNGSGYAQKATPEEYVVSYSAYKKWKKDKYGVEMVQAYPEEAYQIASDMVHARPPGHIPSDKNMNKFLEYYYREISGVLI